MTASKKAVTQAANDASLSAARPVSDAGTIAEYTPGYTDKTVVPHDRVSEVDTSIREQKLTCPKCGKSTLHAEFPDHYEAWVKCSSCHFFMGMSNADWHRMENSPNLNEKIRKMSEKKA
jgi:ribosomal protein S27AE